MNDMAKGKQSSRIAEERRLNLLVRLTGEPATSDELKQIILDKDYEEGVNRSYTGLQKCLENDLNHLRVWFKAQIVYKDGVYSLVELARPLLDLSAEAARGMAFLRHNFVQKKTVMHYEVMEFLKNVEMVLPTRRMRQIDHEQRELELSIYPRDQDEIRVDVREIIRQACNERRLLQFDYAATRDDGVRVNHIVEPLNLYFDSKHYYLEAFCIETYSKVGGVVEQNKFLAPYRVGRIHNPRILPDHFNPDIRRPPRYELVYTLKPQVVRGGITEHIQIARVENHEDGSATVHCISKNLFTDLRSLLHYGANCCVIGGEEAVREMRNIVKAMYEGYFSPVS